MNIAGALLDLFPKLPLEVHESLDENLIRSLVATEGTRFSHLKGAAACARRLGPQLSKDPEFSRDLETAALFHGAV